MAETGKGVTAGKLAINVQKRLNRAQEKVLQKLGKADETRDEAFEEMVVNFNKQMAEGTKLQKDLKTYLEAVKMMHDASRRLQDCLADMYEPDWFGKEELDAAAEDTDTLWLDFHQSITDKSMICMDSYLAQFPEIKARIAKRNRKMVDFDSARHHFASLQKGKKKDEAKIAKAEEDLGRAQKIFEELNVELQDELPVLWDSRVGVYVNTFQSLAGHQEKFHKEMSKVGQSTQDASHEELDHLTASCILLLFLTFSEDPSHHLSQCVSVSLSAVACMHVCGFDLTLLAQRPGPPPSRPPPRLTPSPDQKRQHVDLFENEDEASVPDANTDATTRTQQVRLTTERSFLFAQLGHMSWCEVPFSPHCEPECVCVCVSLIRHLDILLVLPQSAVTNGSDSELPPGFLYKVKAIHDYTATDGDELELKTGDVVLVLAFDNPDEQDDGWLMGLKESQWLEKKEISAKGVFPENFTQRF
uniref:Myc box-dependent-interacting protein 1 n=1 Tax=Anabas testudineus TaxID=64144 RepID=A0A7N6FEL3_ANATE